MKLPQSNERYLFKNLQPISFLTVKQYFLSKIRNKVRISAISVWHCTRDPSQFSKINNRHKGRNETPDSKIWLFTLKNSKDSNNKSTTGDLSNASGYKINIQKNQLCIDILSLNN